jgi:bifunctional NMN adenylyltransferase/nudix hydrolase
MDKTKTPKEEIGVIIGRFQVHDLHEAHRDLINTVIANHKKVILFLGVSPVIGTTKDPLDFTTRKLMIQEHYPDINIAPLPDHRSDSIWSRMIDSRIREIFPIGSVILYGGRDSFLPYYHGHFPTSELEQTVYVSGTEIRKQVSEEIKSSHLWRAGAIYQAYNQYPVSYQTVDIACLGSGGHRILLCKKPSEDKFRFIGGFVDPKDLSLEHAARREFMEETGGNGEISDLKYLGSFRVDDWRYVKGRDKIMTSLFIGEMIFGTIEPSDDISELRWFGISEFKEDGFIEENIVPEHITLAKKVLEEILK